MLQFSFLKAMKIKRYFNNAAINLTLLKQRFENVCFARGSWRWGVLFILSYHPNSWDFLLKLVSHFYRCLASFSQIIKNLILTVQDYSSFCCPFHVENSISLVLRAVAHVLPDEFRFKSNSNWLIWQEICQAKHEYMINVLATALTVWFALHEGAEGKES